MIEPPSKDIVLGIYLCCGADLGYRTGPRRIAAVHVSQLHSGSQG